MTSSTIKQPFCSVCLQLFQDTLGDPGREKLCCLSCRKFIHHRCWGQEKKYELLKEVKEKGGQNSQEAPVEIKRFLCDGCREGKQEKCVICHKSDSNTFYCQQARVVTSDEGDEQQQVTNSKVWVHTLCALFHDACEISSFKDMEVQINGKLQLLPSIQRSSLRCSICSKSDGLLYPNKGQTNIEFAHLLCVKFQMLQELESLREDSKKNGWELSITNIARKQRKHQQQQEDENFKREEEQPSSNSSSREGKMQTRNRSKKTNQTTKNLYYEWVMNNVYTQRGGTIEIRSEDERYDEEVCICQKIINTQEEEDQLWIACDTCSIWYHAKCIGKEPDLVESEKQIEKYYCNRCQNWSKIKNQLINESKPRQHPCYKTLKKQINSKDAYTSQLLPDKILQMNHDFLKPLQHHDNEQQKAEKGRHSHKNLSLCDQILVSWVWQKRAANLVKFECNLNQIMHHLKMANLLPLKGRSSTYNNLVSKCSIAIQAAGNIQDVMLLNKFPPPLHFVEEIQNEKNEELSPALQEMIMKANQNCDIVESVIYKLQNEFKVILPMDYQPYKLSKAINVLLIAMKKRHRDPNVHKLNDEEQLKKEVVVEEGKGQDQQQNQYQQDKVTKEELKQARETTKNLIYLQMPDLAKRNQFMQQQLQSSTPSSQQQQQQYSKNSTSQSFFLDPIPLIQQQHQMKKSNGFNIKSETITTILSLQSSYKDIASKYAQYYTILKDYVIFGAQSKQYALLNQAYKIYIQWQNRYSTIQSKMNQPVTLSKKKRSSLLTSTSIEKKSGKKANQRQTKVRQGVAGALLNNIEIDEEWLSCYHKECQNKLKMSEAYQHIEKGENLIIVQMEKGEIETLKQYSKKFQRVENDQGDGGKAAVSPAGGGMHSKLLQKLFLKRKKRPKNRDDVIEMRDIVEQIVLEMNVLPLEIEKGFIEEFTKMINWKKEVASVLLISKNQVEVEGNHSSLGEEEKRHKIFQINPNKSIDESLNKISTELINQIPSMLPESEHVPIKDAMASLQKWKGRYEFFLTECVKSQKIKEYIEEFISVLKEFDAFRNFQELSLLQRKLYLIENVDKFKNTIFKSASNKNQEEQQLHLENLRSLAQQIEHFGLVQMYEASGIMEALVQAQEMERQIQELIAKSLEQQQNIDLAKLYQVCYRPVNFQVDMRRLKALISRVEWSRNLILKFEEQFNVKDPINTSVTELLNLIPNNVVAQQIKMYEQDIQTSKNIEPKLAQRMLFKLKFYQLNCNLINIKAQLASESSQRQIFLAKVCAYVDDQYEQAKQLINQRESWLISADQSIFDEINDLKRDLILLLNSLGKTEQILKQNEKRTKKISFGDLMMNIRSFEECQSILHKYSNLKLSQIEIYCLNKLEAWCKIVQIIDQFHQKDYSFENIQQSQGIVIKQILNSQLEQSKFQSILKFIQTSTQSADKYIQGISLLKKTFQAHIQWKEQLTALFANQKKFSLVEGGSNPRINQKYSIIYLQNLLSNESMRLYESQLYQNLIQMKQKYHQLQDRGESILFSIQNKKQNLFNQSSNIGQNQKLNQIEQLLSGYQKLSISDDPKKAPFIYKNCLFIKWIVETLKIQMIIDQLYKTEGKQSFDCQKYEVDEFQNLIDSLFYIFNKKRPESKDILNEEKLKNVIESIKSNQLWNDLIIPQELSHISENIANILMFLTDILKISITIDQLVSKLSQFESKSEKSQKISTYEDVCALQERIKFFGKIIEFDDGSCERIHLMLENVNKVNQELDKIQIVDDDDEQIKNQSMQSQFQRQLQKKMPKIRQYIDIYHVIRRLPLEHAQLNTTVKIILNKTKRIKNQIQDVMAQYQKEQTKNAPKFILTLMSKTRVEQLLKRYFDNNIQFDQGQRLKVMYVSSCRLIENLRNETLPKLKQLHTQSESLDNQKGNKFESKVKKIHEIQTLLYAADSQIKNEMHVDFGVVGFHEIQKEILQGKLHYFITKIQGLLMVAKVKGRQDGTMDIALNQIKKHKLRPKYDFFVQLEAQVRGFSSKEFQISKKQLIQLQNLIKQGRNLREKLLKTESTRKYEIIKNQILAQCIDFSEELLEQGIKVRVTDQNAETHEEQADDRLLVHRNKSEHYSSPSNSRFSLNQIIDDLEKKPSSTSPDTYNKTPGRKRQMHQMVDQYTPSFTQSDPNDHLKSRVQARRHLQSIMTGAYIPNYIFPKPPAMQEYSSHISQTKELALVLQNYAFEQRPKLDFGYDAFINRFSHPLVKLQGYKNIAQELLKIGEKKMKPSFLLKICKSNVDVIFDEKLQNLQNKIINRKQKEEEQQRKANQSQEMKQSEKRKLENILETTTKFSQSILMSEQQKKQEEQREKSQDFVQKLERLNQQHYQKEKEQQEDKDSDSLMSQDQQQESREYAAFSPTNNINPTTTTNLDEIPPSSFNFEQGLLQSNSYQILNQVKKPEKQAENQQMYDPFLNLSNVVTKPQQAIIPEKLPQQKKEPQIKGVYKLWQGKIIMNKSSSCLIPTRILTLESNLRLRSLSQINLHVLKLSARCKLDDVYNFFSNKNQGRFQTLGWLDLDLASPQKQTMKNECVNYFKELNQDRKVGLIKHNSTSFYILPWNNAIPDLQCAWFDWENKTQVQEKKSSIFTRFGVLISHKKGILETSMEPVLMKQLSQEEFYEVKKNASNGNSLLPLKIIKNSDPEYEQTNQQGQIGDDDEGSLQSVKGQNEEEKNQQIEWREQMKLMLQNTLLLQGNEKIQSLLLIKNVLTGLIDEYDFEVVSRFIDSLGDQEKQLIEEIQRTGQGETQQVETKQLMEQSQSQQQQVESKKENDDGTSYRLKLHLDEQKRNIDQQIFQSYECVMKYMNLNNMELKKRIQHSQKLRYQINQ